MCQQWPDEGGQPAGRGFGQAPAQEPAQGPAQEPIRADASKGAKVISAPGKARRGRWAWRCACYSLTAVFTVLVFAVIAMVGLAWRLSQGPVRLDAFAPRITETLQHRLAEGFLVSLTGAALERRGSGPTLTVLGLSIKDASGREIISAPKAEVDFDPLRLFRNDAGLRRLSLIEPQFKASISRQGEISLMTAFSQPMAAPRPRTRRPTRHPRPPTRSPPIMCATA